MANVVCVNVGTKYSKQYTETLYSMVRRNITGELNFYVITDREHTYEQPIQEIIVPGAEPNWWSKFLLFRPDILGIDYYLYLDLDVVVVNSLDSYFSGERFRICRDFIRPDSGLIAGKEYNSSVMYFNPLHTQGLYDYYNKHELYWKGCQQSIAPFFGDQNVISSYLNHYPEFVDPFPDDEIWSYKKGWERGKYAGDRSRYFGEEIPPNGKICVFHGEPNPSEVDTSWVKEHYTIR